VAVTLRSARMRADESSFTDGEGVWSRSPDAGIKFRETSVSLGDGGYQSPDTRESAR
jgi:hypothetical protein